ncbi:MAG: class I SAM-dependent methyltransferase [Acidobacteriota bacterium]
MRALPPGARILELAPGTGQVARLTGRGDLAWSGIEGCLDCLPALRRHLSSAAIMDLDSLRRLPAGFDVIVAADVLEHLADPERTLRLAHTALGPGGRLLLSVPNVANLHVRLNLLLGRFPYAKRGILDETHRVFFTRASISALVTKCGFKIERRGMSAIPLPLALPGWPPTLVKALAWLLDGATRLLPTLLGYQVLLTARR